MQFRQQQSIATQQAAALQKLQGEHDKQAAACTQLEAGLAAATKQQEALEEELGSKQAELAAVHEQLVGKAAYLKLLDCMVASHRATKGQQSKVSM